MYATATQTFRICQISPAIWSLFHYSLLRITYLGLPVKSESHHEQNNWIISTLWRSFNLALFLKPRKDKIWLPGALQENESRIEKCMFLRLRRVKATHKNVYFLWILLVIYFTVATIQFYVFSVWILCTSYTPCYFFYL